MRTTLKTLLLTAAALPLIGLGATGFAFDAQAQTKTPGQMETGGLPPMKVTTSEYIQQAAMGDMFEIESSKLAAGKSANKDIKSFAERMVKDHSASTKKINEASVKGKAGVTPPAELDGEHKAKLAVLRNASGAEFDKQYVSAQIEAHEKALRLHQGYAKNGDNKELKDAADDIAEHVEDHLEKIKDIQKSMSKS